MLLDRKQSSLGSAVSSLDHTVEHEREDDSEDERHGDADRHADEVPRVLHDEVVAGRVAASVVQRVVGRAARRRRRA